jgi:hypothetical protein
MLIEDIIKDKHNSQFRCMSSIYRLIPADKDGAIDFTFLNLLDALTFS